MQWRQDVSWIWINFYYVYSLQVIFEKLLNGDKNEEMQQGAGGKAIITTSLQNYKTNVYVNLVYWYFGWWNVYPGVI